jgi:hypothetical protein
MDLKAFGHYLERKSIARLLHAARKESLRRISAQETAFGTPRHKKPAQKRTGTR